MSFGRRASEEDEVPAPKAYADARRPCVQPRTQLGNLNTPIGSRGPFQAGGQAPPFHRVTKSRQGEFYDGHPEAQWIGFGPIYVIKYWILKEVGPEPRKQNPINLTLR